MALLAPNEQNAGGGAVCPGRGVLSLEVGLGRRGFGGKSRSVAMGPPPQPELFPTFWGLLSPLWVGAGVQLPLKPPDSLSMSPALHPQAPVPPNCFSSFFFLFLSQLKLIFLQ